MDRGNGIFLRSHKAMLLGSRFQFVLLDVRVNILLAFELHAVSLLRRLEILCFSNVDS